MFAFIMGIAGICLMVFLVAIIASNEDNYVHPWDYEFDDDYELNTEDDANSGNRI